MSFSVRKKQFFGKNGNLTTCTWKHCIDGTFFGVIFILFLGKKIIAHRRTKFQTQFSTLTHQFLTFSCQKKSWKGFLSLVTQEKTLVTQRESLLTLWKTLVTQGKTLVTKQKGIPCWLEGKPWWPWWPWWPMHYGPRGFSRQCQLYEHLFCMFWASN